MSFAVCLSSVTFVRPTQLVEIFGNVSTPFRTLVIRWHPGKILRRSSHGTPLLGALDARWIAKYSDFAPIEGYILETVHIWYKLLLITNRKSHMSFRLVPNWMTLNDLERRNTPYFVFLIEFGSFRGALRKSGWRYTDTICGRNVAKRM